MMNKYLLTYLNCYFSFQFGTNNIFDIKYWMVLPYWGSRSVGLGLFCILMLLLFYFIVYLLCILTGFWVLRAPKSWSKHFFSRFQPFLFISKLFHRNQSKNAENIKKSTEKKQFWGTTSGSQPAFACQLALRSRRNHVFFCSFSDVF